jgi:glycosyltransferase involved in cell wall biosynthesis
MSKNLKIGWLSNGPHTHSGYATQTRIVTKRLKDAGHEPFIFCTHGLDSGIMHHDGIPLLPRGNHFWGQDIVGPYSRQFKTDLTICFLDAWVMEPWNYGPGVRAVTLFPVDHEPLADNIRGTIRQFWDRICYSKSAVKAVNEAGLDCHYVPHGIETDVFKPLDRVLSRTICNIPQDRFVIGVVAANHDPMPCPRKNWKNILEGFALFQKRYCPDALLYLHSPLATTTGVDIRGKVERLGLRGKVHATDQEQLRQGLPDSWMAHLYNAFDVLLAPSMGEGFCLPLVEAQSCGTPVITSGWSATEELCFSGLLIDKSEANRIETGDFVYWYEAPAEVICEYLKAFYCAESHWPMMREAAREKVVDYDIDTIFRTHWIPTLGAMAERIAEENASVGASLRPAPDQKYKIDLLNATVAAVEQDPPNVVIVCPSAGEKCGIAEYAKSAARSLNDAGIVPLILPTVESGCVAALAPSVRSIIVLHEFAFFDNFNVRLGRGETTAQMVKALRSVLEVKPTLSVGVQMHSVTMHPDYAPFIKYMADQFRETPIRLFSTCMGGAFYLSRMFNACSELLQLGIHQVGCPVAQPPDDLRFGIGNFGMFGEQRDIQKQLDLCTATDSRFMGSFYCEYEVTAEGLHLALERYGLSHDATVFTDWAEDDAEIIKRLQTAHCLYMPRVDNDIHHSSASALTAMSARRPIIINRAGCYEDLWDVLLVAETQDEAKAIIDRLKTDPVFYAQQVAKQERYFVDRDIARVWKDSGIA